jgi:hypothetical protein
MDELFRGIVIAIHEQNGSAVFGMCFCHEL